MTLLYDDVWRAYKVPHVIVHKRYNVMRIKRRLTFLPVCMGLAIFLMCALNIDAK